MDLAKIDTAKRRRNVAVATSAGYTPQEIAITYALTEDQVIEDLVWLTERRKQRISERMDISDVVTDEVMQLEDDEAMLRRWLHDNPDLTMSSRFKLMDRLQKMRELRLRLLGAFDHNTKPPSQHVVLVGFDGRTQKVVDIEERALPAGEVTVEPGRDRGPAD